MEETNRQAHQLLEQTRRKMNENFVVPTMHMSDPWQMFFSALGLMALSFSPFLILPIHGPLFISLHHFSLPSFLLSFVPSLPLCLPPTPLPSFSQLYFDSVYRTVGWKYLCFWLLLVVFMANLDYWHIQLGKHK